MPNPYFPYTTLFFLSFFSFHNTAILDLDELQHRRTMLVTAFNFDCHWLAAEFFAIGMLSSQHRDNILNMKSTLTENDKADIIVSAIMAKLRLDSNNLGCIVEVLKGKPSLYREAIALLEGKNNNINSNS